MIGLPSVSVSVPVRNARQTLARCLAAIADSDYRAYECVVVDDGSTDGSASLARRRGLTGAARAVPLHWLYFVYSSAAFGLGTALHTVERLHARRSIPLNLRDHDA